MASTPAPVNAAVRLAYAKRVQELSGLEPSPLIDAFATVPREAFVGPGPWKIVRPSELPGGYALTPDDDPKRLYDNVLVALDEARKLNNGEPAALAMWLGALRLAPGVRFLHIGCGVGYYTAIAAHAVAPGGTVVGVELDPSLGGRAIRNLERYVNVRVVVGDGSAALDGVFDAAFVNAGATELLPVWLDCLAEGGRVLVPLTVAEEGAGAGMGQMLLVTHRGDQYNARFVSGVGIFNCEGARTPEGNERLREAYDRGGYERVRSLRRDAHMVETRCWLHAPSFCLSLNGIGG